MLWQREVFSPQGGPGLVDTQVLQRKSVRISATTHGHHVHRPGPYTLELGQGGSIQLLLSLTIGLAHAAQGFPAPAGHGEMTVIQRGDGAGTGKTQLLRICAAGCGKAAQNVPRSDNTDLLADNGANGGFKHAAIARRAHARAGLQQGLQQRICPQYSGDHRRVGVQIEHAPYPRYQGHQLLQVGQM